jgi:large subunit ribosomal protein L9
MQVILREEVANLGKSGDVVTVRDGYGRNYLIPQGLAVPATERNVRQVEHQKKLIAARNAKLAKDAQAVADKLAGLEVVISRQAGEADRLFGSVTARDIEEALRGLGVTVDRKKIHLPEPIKSLGDYSVDVKLGQAVTGKVKVRVVQKSS